MHGPQRILDAGAVTKEDRPDRTRRHPVIVGDCIAVTRVLITACRRWSSPCTCPLERARDYFGNLESSRKMKAVWPWAGRQFRALAGRTSWRSGPFSEFQLVARRDPVGARHRDLGLQLAAAVIDGAAMHGGHGRWAPFPGQGACTGGSRLWLAGLRLVFQ
jgi:hypothetical protein